MRSIVFSSTDWDEGAGRISPDCVMAIISLMSVGLAVRCEATTSETMFNQPFELGPRGRELESSSGARLRARNNEGKTGAGFV